MNRTFDNETTIIDQSYTSYSQSKTRNVSDDVASASPPPGELRMNRLRLWHVPPRHQ